MNLDWLLSTYDQQVHAFPTEQDSAVYRAAKCDHTAPTTRVINTDEGRKCIACLVIVGDELAQKLGDSVWRH